MDLLLREARVHARPIGGDDLVQQGYEILQAWWAYHDRLDACPAVVALCHSVPGLAFLHQLVIALHRVCVEIGACGIRPVCLVLELTGLNRFVAASYGSQPKVNRRVEEAIVVYRQEESQRLAHEMPARDITLTQDETFTGGLCLMGVEPVSNSILLEQAAQARDHDTWQACMEPALAGLNCTVIQSISDETPGHVGCRQALGQQEAHVGAEAQVLGRLMGTDERVERLALRL